MVTCSETIHGLRNLTQLGTVVGLIVEIVGVIFMKFLKSVPSMDVAEIKTNPTLNLLGIKITLNKTNC